MTVAAIPFTPSHFSVNRVRIVDLPGVQMDEGVAGQLAYHLASVLAMTTFARDRAADLQLPEAFFDDGPATRAGLPRFIDASLDSPDSRVRAAAEAVATQVGRNLGHVLLTLHRGDQVNRDARADWAGVDWERWAEVRTVILAGGLTSGRLGETIRLSAAEWLASAGYPDLISIERSPFGGNTSLFGAARYLPPDAGPSLCCDFGHTSVKRALVYVSGDAILQISALSPVPVEDAWHLHPDADLARAGQRYKAFVVDTVCHGLAQAAELEPALAADIMLCIASYVDGGRLIGNGSYATISLLAADVRPFLAEAVTAHTGRPCRVHLIHDGTAAAAVFAGRPNTAVIALGTALGVGFAPASAEGLRIIKAAQA